MSQYSELEKQGLVEFFYYNETNTKILMSIAKTISKMKDMTPKDALDVVLVHSSGVLSILNRKAITREVLFKYLHAHRVPVYENFTKLLLIERMIEYWQTRNKDSGDISQNLSQSVSETPVRQINTEHFPINLMSRQFCTWFFENFNKEILKLNDFWVDCFINIRILAAGQDINDNETNGNQPCLDMLLNLKRQLSILFNPNLCHEGVQGRIDPHGLVVLMCCGTVHSQTQCVGLFESAFGLMRDPYNDNNWRIKHLKLQIKSSQTDGMPKLNECDSLQQILALPETSDVI
uniref:CSON014928 protein n=1 Tax=Culicoides sonorensis TaxID=179676 RepID=A0A336MES1_CULSO